MNFEALKRRVERSESLLEGRALQTRERYERLKTTWRASWTPTRILAAGLLAGFVTGRSAPTRTLRRIGKLGGPRWIRLISSVSGLITSLQAAVAAFTAKGAAKTAEQAAGDAEHAADTVHSAAATAAGAAPAAAHATQAATTARPAQTPQPAADELASAEVESAAAEPQSAADRRRRPDPALHPQSRPAEAATDVSER